MKRINHAIIALALVSYSLMSCAQSTKEEAKPNQAQAPAMQQEATLEMNQDTLDNRVIADIEKEISARKAELTAQTLTAIDGTHALLKEIVDGDKDKAISKGKELIGDFEVSLAKDPSLTFLPVDIKYRKDELTTDIVTVRKTVRLAEKAMLEGYYQEAADLLGNLRSEMIVSTYLLPTATYPEAIKAAIVLLEEDNKDEAAEVLQEVLSTVVIEETVHPLPVLNAEQMIIEAALIDDKNHEHSDQVINLLKNADYQLTLAQEMGYGKKDKEYAVLAKSIKALKKSVENKKESSSLFDQLKKDMREFQERLFTNKK